MIFGTDGGMGDIAAALHIREWIMKFLAGSTALPLAGAGVQPAEPTLGTWSIEQSEDGVIGGETNLVPFSGGRVPA